MFSNLHAPGLITSELECFSQLPGSLQSLLSEPLLDQFAGAALVYDIDESLKLVLAVTRMDLEGAADVSVPRGDSTH